MKSFWLIAAVLIASVCSAAAQVTYASTEAKAQRFFDNKEWGSAAAMYTYMLSQKPDVTDIYGHAIVANEMLGDSVRAMELLTQAMNYSVPLDSLLTCVQKNSFQIGHSELYENFMLKAARDYKWLERPLDAYLLRYYVFRHNAPQIVAYAQKLLKGAPTNAKFLSVLADDYMQLGLTSDAVATWQKIIELHNDDYDALLQLANYYDLNNDPTAALFYFERANSIFSTPYINERIAKLSGGKKFKSPNE